jgi:CTP synthase (UTP-ammonia lyase)
MWRGIELAREKNRPFLATCGGFQYALIEFSRNVLDLADADTAENNSGSKNVVSSAVACALPGRRLGAPNMSGSDSVRPVAATLVD